MENPAWDRGNKYTMAWQSGWTAIGYNSSIDQEPGRQRRQILFDKKYAGKVGMMADPQELGSLGLLAIGVEPATSTESDWAKAAKKLQTAEERRDRPRLLRPGLHQPPEERRHGGQPGVVG